MTYFYNFPVNMNLPSVTFRSNHYNQNIIAPQPSIMQDKFVTVPIYNRIGTAEQIQSYAENNPRIKELLSQYNLPLKVNKTELQKLQEGHLSDTRLIVAKMYSALPNEEKNKVNLVNLQEAAMLHDYGKILIPDKILNKKEELTLNERSIIELHSELGYELLKEKGVNKETLNLVKYHHQNPQGNGYPEISNDFEYDLSAQIITTADKYSALREERSYKPALSKDEALAIIKQDVKDGFLSDTVYNALVKST